jgi:hyaluronan synthase
MTLQSIKNTFKNDMGGQFLFFFVLYLIVLIKVLNGFGYYSHNYFFFVYSMIIGIYILSRFLLSYFYTIKLSKEYYEPTVTFVVPAKNEEDNIAETIRRFSQVDYPKEKIEVITINDGSTDNTLAQMLEVKRECEQKGVTVHVLDWKVNQGKRAGMAEGVKLAKNEIIIFVDSDSFIDPSCVRHLVKCFAEKRIGAVSGHTDVHNADENLLTKMQAVRYYVAFKIYKAAESIFGSVTCCPGCCSAYRKEYILPVMDEWLNQRFWGVRCTFGDDRSLTNFVIRKYDAIYVPEAKAVTVVPNTLRKYMKQQQRWKKSWIRETFIASMFMWKKNIFAAISFYSYIFLAFAAPLVFFNAAIYYPFFKTHAIPFTYLSGLALMLILHGVYYRNHKKGSRWFLPVLTFWFYTIMLIWQLPWAFITMNDTRWGTR